MLDSSAIMRTNLLPEQSRAFARYLYGLHERGDSGALAQIRRAHIYGTDETALRVIGTVVPADVHSRTLDAYLLTAGLFAVYITGAEALPDRRLLHDTNRTIGASARLVPNRTDSLNQRFAVLLARPYEDLSDELRRFLRLLRSKGAPVDFARLLRDLVYWNHPDRFVQRDWASSFWQGTSEEVSAS